MQLPSALSNVARSVVGRFALYAPRDAGAMTIWRGVLADPWSPETDLIVAVPRVGNEAIFRLLVADAGPRIVLEREPLLAVRPAHRGVTLADVLETSASSRLARPPLELLALLTRALDRPGLRVQRITSPHQIIISWDGDVFVDGLDPAARARPWADGDGLRADIEACLVAAVARGRVDFVGARALVDEVALSVGAQPGRDARGGVVERAICGRFAVAAGKGHELDDVVDLAAARAVVSGLVRGLFPERVAYDQLAVEELATLGEEALATWTHRPPVAAPPTASLGSHIGGHIVAPGVAATMRRGAIEEQALVATELAALVEEGRRAIVPIVRAPVFTHAPLLERLARWLREAWHIVRHRVASARVPRLLPTKARPAPPPRRRRKRRRLRGGSRHGRRVNLHP